LDPEPNDGKGAGIAPIGHAITIEAPTFEDWTIEAIVKTRPGIESISDEEKTAAASDVKAAIEAEMLACITQAESAYPTGTAYTFEFTRSMFVNAIMGDNTNPRFSDVISIIINGETFTGASYEQTAKAHIMPRFESLTLIRSEA
jgi:hypothetical protein